jgi:hypothetical protein
MLMKSYATFAVTLNAGFTWSGVNDTARRLAPVADSAGLIAELRLLAGNRLEKRQADRMVADNSLFSPDATVGFILPEAGHHPIAEQVLAQFDTIQPPGGCESHTQCRSNGHGEWLGDVVSLIDHISALNVERES